MIAGLVSRPLVTPAAANQAFFAGVLALPAMSGDMSCRPEEQKHNDWGDCPLAIRTLQPVGGIHVDLTARDVECLSLWHEPVASMAANRPILESRWRDAVTGSPVTSELLNRPSEEAAIGPGRGQWLTTFCVFLLLLPFMTISSVVHAAHNYQHRPSQPSGYDALAQIGAPAATRKTDPQRRWSRQSVSSAKTCTYQGGPKTGLWTCR